MFMELCDSADLRQYIPKEYIEGGVDINGEQVLLDSTEWGSGLRAAWLGDRYQRGGVGAESDEGE